MNRRVILWRGSFANSEEKVKVIEKIKHEVIPPEVFPDEDNFIAEEGYAVD